jgi:hypothetical protein
MARSLPLPLQAAWHQPTAHRGCTALPRWLLPADCSPLPCPGSSLPRPLCRGLPDRLIDSEAARLLKQLGLSEFADRACGSYSGGNRRKLSVAVALVGGAQVRPAVCCRHLLVLPACRCGPLAPSACCCSWPGDAAMLLLLLLLLLVGPLLCVLARNFVCLALSPLASACRWCCWTSPRLAWTQVGVGHVCGGVVWPLRCAVTWAAPAQPLLQA